MGTWLDQSSSALIFEQTTDANRPQFVASSAPYGNRPLVESTNTTMWLAATAGLVVAQPLSIIVVGECDTSAGTMFAAGNSGQTAPILFNSLSTRINSGVTLTDAAAFSAPGVVLAEFNGISSFVGNSNWLTGGTSGDAGTSATVKFATGAYNDGAFGAVCKIAEVVACSRLLSVSEKATMAGYFIGRYGLAIT